MAVNLEIEDGNPWYLSPIHIAGFRSGESPKINFGILNRHTFC